MKNVSLRYKLFLVLSATILIYTAFSVLFINSYLKGVLKRHLIDMGRTFASSISSHIESDVLVRDFVSIDTFFENTIKNNHDVSYVFIEKGGQVLVHTFHDGFPRGLMNIGHKRNAADYVLVETGSENIYDFSHPIFGGREGTLRLGITGKTIQEILAKTVRSLVYVAMATIIIALAASMVISRKLVKPLSMLTESALEIATGDYSKSIQAEGEDEVGRLSMAFNEMGNAVRVREKELREINDELEAVNIRLNEYIHELNRTKDELIKSKQDSAVVQTARSMIHHMRQPLTYLIMAIELFTEDIQGGTFNADIIQKRLFAIEEASLKVSEILKKFEQLREYRVVEYSDKTKIVDIGE